MTDLEPPADAGSVPSPPCEQIEQEAAERPKSLAPVMADNSPPPSTSSAAAAT
jgi:hypothetical protein